MPHPVADIFTQAAQLNLADERRKGNTVWMESGCDVLITGDIHGNRKSLTKVIAHARLDAPSPRPRRLVLQEVIHGPPDAVTGTDRSIELMMRIARLKIAHPREVVLLLGNHDVAQVTGNEITKEGRGACKSFNDAVRAEFKQHADEILSALSAFCLSMPLACRFPNGVLATHSLPTPARMERAGVEILDRPTAQGDLVRGGAIYEWTWGRSQTPEQARQLGQRLGVEFFVLGHRHVATGFEFIGPCAVTLASEHDHGCAFEFGSDEPITAENAPAHIRKILAL